MYRAILFYLVFLVFFILSAFTIKNKKNKVIYYVIILIIMGSMFFGTYRVLKQIKNNQDNKTVEEQYKEIKEIKTYINNRQADVTFEDNMAVKELAVRAPFNHLTLQDLNNNGKYYCFEKSLTTDSSKQKKAKKGDIMLYKSNCIVIFYTDAQNEYNYTKIGHVNNIDDYNIGSENITLSIHSIHEY